MKIIKKIVGMSGFPTIMMLIVMLIIVVYMQPNFFQAQAFRNSINSWAPIILLSMGQAIVLISGGLDLSSGTAMSMFLCIMAKTMESQTPASGFHALILVIIAVIIVGLVNGIAVGYLRLPPLVATFASSYIWLGIALFFLPTPGGHVTNWFRIFYDARMVTNIAPGIKSLAEKIPTALILVLVACLAWFLISRTRTGRHFYAVGSNRDTAYDSGISVGKTMIKAYIINAFFILLCAMFFVAQNQSGSARLGDPLTLQCIAAAVVGGIALTGGKGSVYMAIAGTIVLALVKKIVFFSDIANEYQILVGGIIIIAAIALSSIVAMRRESAIAKGESG